MPGRQRNNDTGHFPEPRGAHAKTRRLSSSPVEFPWELPSEPVPIWGEAQPPAAFPRLPYPTAPSTGQCGPTATWLSGRECVWATDTRVQTRVRTQSHSFTLTNKNNFRRRNKGI